MTGGDDQFYAWLDGELRGDEAAAMEARVASSPELSRLADEDRALKKHLSGAFDAVAEAPVPDRLLSAARADAETTLVVDFASEARSRRMQSSRPSQWMAMAASLAVGVLIGASVIGSRSGGPIAVQSGTLYAAGDLENGLNVQLASAPVDGPVRVGITYRDRSGAICRTFTAQLSGGLACRDGERWRLLALVEAATSSNSDYRMATSIDPAIAEKVASSISGEPFGPAQEQAAKRSGWTG